MTADEYPGLEPVIDDIEAVPISLRKETFRKHKNQYRQVHHVDWTRKFIYSPEGKKIGQKKAVPSTRGTKGT